MANFDFDHWSELARRDPESFFRARRLEIGRFIAAHPPSEGRRLREMQRRIDCIRANAGSPMKALMSLMAMMQDRLRLLQEHTRALERVSGGLRDSLVALEIRRSLPRGPAAGAAAQPAPEEPAPPKDPDPGGRRPVVR